MELYFVCFSYEVNFCQFNGISNEMHVSENDLEHITFACFYTEFLMYTDKCSATR